MHTWFFHRGCVCVCLAGSAWLHGIEVGMILQRLLSAGIHPAAKMTFWVFVWVKYFITCWILMFFFSSPLHWNKQYFIPQLALISGCKKRKLQEVKQYKCTNNLWYYRVRTGTLVWVNSGTPLLRLAMDIHMTNTHLEAGGGVKIPAPRPIMIQLCRCWPERQTEEAGIVTNRAGIVYCWSVT